ncbi:MAG: TM2 domain-containing protein [Flavobacterium sp.]|nr:TM2 domain-containing protein [Pedobacter sp.]
MTYQNLVMNLRGVTPSELLYLEQVMKNMNEEQAKSFIVFYSGKRKDPQDILLFTLLGFVIIAGVQRFILGQIGMGILYFFTGGLCLVGTIVDLVNFKSLTSDYNQKMAYECAQMIHSMNSASR